MQRAFIPVIALALSMGLVNCSKNNSSNGAGPAAPPVDNTPAAPSWQLKQMSTCAEGVAAEDCLASQGFVVDADGNFKVGPAANGKTLTGKLSEEEMKSLKAKLIQAELIPAEGQASISGTASEQKVSMAAGESNDIITLTLAKKDAQQVIHTSGEEFTFLTTATEAQAVETAAGNAQAVQNELRTLATAHYPLPFPNLCTDKVDEVKASVYTSLQTCQVDADCSYIDWNTDSAIPNDVHQFVITDNGNYLAPVIVANSSSLADPALNAKLVEAYTQVDAVCKFQRPDFTEQKGFYADQAAPVCAANVCTVNPAITF